MEKPKVEETVKPLKHPDRVYQLDELTTAKIEANGTQIDVWIADTDGKRMEGLMFLKPEDIKERQGMLFIFPSIQGPDQGFWMRNTFTPLDIVYIGQDRRVVSIGKGQPLNETSVLPGAEYQYVLELEQGEAAKLGIKKGTQVDIPAEIVAEG